MDEVVTVTIEHIDLEPNQAQAGQQIYNFALTIRGDTNDHQVANDTKWNPVAECWVTKQYPIDPRVPNLPMLVPITFTEAPYVLNAASDGRFELTLKFSLSKAELFDNRFDPDAIHVQLQLKRLRLVPLNRDLKISREVVFYISNSNSVESDAVVAFK